MVTRNEVFLESINRIEAHLYLVIEFIEIQSSEYFELCTKLRTTVRDRVTADRRAPLLEGGHSTKIGSMWTLKHEISSPKFYELLIKT